jgi:hypothetical protein
MAYFLITLVTFRNEIAAPEVRGRVISVQRSSDHNYPELQIKEDDGSVAMLLGISEASFGTIRVENQFSKSAGATSAIVSGREVELLEPSVLDALRRRAQ